MNINKKTIIVFFLICISLCVPYSINAESDNNLLYKADSLFDKGHYFKASIAYEKFLFYNADSKFATKTKIKKAYCYRFLHRHEDALNELNRINFFSLHDTLKNLIYYEKSLNFLMLEQPVRALFNLNQIRPEFTRNRQILAIKPLQVLILNHNREWKAAQDTFISLINNLNIKKKLVNQYKDSINIHYSRKNLPKNYSSEKAKNWSRFIPGAGQIYAGRTWEGITSFVLNAAAITFGFHQAYFKFWITGYFVGFGTFYKTYFGGMERASFLAKTERHNEMTIFNEYCSRIMLKAMEHSNAQNTN